MFLCVFGLFLCSNIKNENKNKKNIILIHFQLKSTFEKHYAPQYPSHKINGKNANMILIW
jgi:hypothetical protein